MVPVLILLAIREAREREDTKTVTVIQNRIGLSVVIGVQSDVGEWSGEMYPSWKCDHSYEPELFME